MEANHNFNIMSWTLLVHIKMQCFKNSNIGRVTMPASQWNIYSCIYIKLGVVKEKFCHYNYFE